MPGPLEGVKVVELGMWVAGPACAGILADWGADVVKLEPPGIGDPARTYQALFGEVRRHIAPEVTKCLPPNWMVCCASRSYRLPRSTKRARCIAASGVSACPAGGGSMLRV